MRAELERNRESEEADLKVQILSHAPRLNDVVQETQGAVILEKPSVCASRSLPLVARW